jgi:DNA-binding GntR family transcriptional regulator
MTAMDDRPLYEVIRDQIIDQITGGTAYPAGALLPSVRELTVQWTVSTTTARRVLAELVNAGYARAEGPRGHVSTGGPAAGGQRQPETAPSAPAPSGKLAVRSPQVIRATAGIEGERITVDVRTEHAPADIAAALRLPGPGQPVVVRRRVTADERGLPVQLRTSYLPRPVAEGTPLAMPEPVSEPWPDALAIYAGRPATVTDSRISARHPTDSEAAVFGLALSACLLVRTDVTHDDTGVPADCTITVWPADGVSLALG